jgi:hypothetical protein
MATQDNNRRFTRVDINVEVRVKTDRSVQIGGQARNLSLNGVYVVTYQCLPVETECEVVLVLQKYPTPRQIHAEGIVCRVTDGGMAIEFTAITPDNLAQLQHLIRYNAEDSEAIEEEISQSAGIRRSTAG